MSTSTFAVVHREWCALDPGALRPLVESYFDHLVSQGYRESTLGYLGHMARHFCYWLNQANISVAEINDGVVKEFAAHRCKCPGCRASQTMSAPSIAGARKFIGFLERAQAIHRPAPPLGDDRLHAYVDWLRQHRGSSEMTIAGYRDVMNQLLDKLGPDPRKYDAALVRGVMQAETGVDASVRLRLEVLSVAPVSDVLHCHRDAAAFVGVLQEIGECPDLSQDALRTVPACDCGCLAAGGLGVPGAWLRPHLHVPEPFITPVPIKSKPNVQVNRENFL